MAQYSGAMHARMNENCQGIFARPHNATVVSFPVQQNIALQRRILHSIKLFHPKTVSRTVVVIDQTVKHKILRVI